MNMVIIYVLHVYITHSIETKEEEFIKAVEEATAKSGKISRNLAHLMFVGPPESGKSSLMDHLLNRLRKRERSFLLPLVCVMQSS